MPYFKTENGNAENIKYDNTNTGLEAANVQDAITEVNGNLGVQLISESVVAFVSGYSGTSKLYRSGNTYMLEISVNGNMSATETGIGVLNSYTYNLPTATFGTGRYGIRGTNAISASGMILPTKYIRIQGNGTTNGNYAECTFIYM